MATDTSLTSPPTCSATSHTYASMRVGPAVALAAAEEEGAHAGSTYVPTRVASAPLPSRLCTSASGSHELASSHEPWLEDLASHE